MRGTNQGGSLAGFIIIGVLLALVLIGGLYGLNRYNAQRAVEDTIADGKEETSQITDRQRTDTESDKKAAEEASKPAPAAQDNKQTESPRPQPTAPQAATAANLPQTGPADTLMALVAVGALAFASTHYVRSRN